MPYLSPPTLTQAEQRALLAATTSHPRDHVIFSLALGTGLRLGEIVGLNVADVYFSDGSPRTRVRLRPEIAKGGRAGDVFLPDALVERLGRFWLYKQARRERLDPSAPLFCNQGRRRISKVYASHCTPSVRFEATFTALTFRLRLTGAFSPGGSNRQSFLSL
jgi:integrase